MKIIKDWKNFNKINEETGIQNLSKITKHYDNVEIYFHMDLDGVTTAIAMKDFLEKYYQIKTTDAHVIQYGGKEYSIKPHKKGNLAVLVDFSHGKPMFHIHSDHHDTQTTNKQTYATHFKPSAKSNVEMVSGEIAYTDIFPPKDVELITTVDSADFLKYNIKPEDVQESIFKYNKLESAEKNRFMMGFVVNRLLLAYKNKRISVKSLDGQNKHKNKNILECLVLDSNPSLYSIYNNLRHYINNAKVSDRAGKLATQEQIKKNLSDYIDRMKKYKFIEKPGGNVREFDPYDPEHKYQKAIGAKIGKGVHYDEENKIIMQYGGGDMFKPGSYDRYVPFKNFPDANFLVMLWPMGLIQISKNPFKELNPNIKNIDLGDSIKHILNKYETELKNYYISLLDIKKEFEISQDFIKMRREEKPGYKSVGFKWDDLRALYKDDIYRSTDDGSIIKIDINDDKLKKIVNIFYEELTEENKKFLKEFKITAYDLIKNSSGGHKDITNLSGMQFLKYNKENMKKYFNTNNYIDVLKKVARDLINLITSKLKNIDDMKNENFNYEIIDKNNIRKKISRDDFIKRGYKNLMKFDKGSLLDIDHENKKVVVKFEKFNHFF